MMYSKPLVCLLIISQLVRTAVISAKHKHPIYTGPGLYNISIFNTAGS